MKFPIEYIKEDDSYIFNCPHCDSLIQVLVDQLACCIFRHAYYKRNYEQINPHSSKVECDKLISNNLIFGCAKPFRIIKDINKPYVEICDYI